MPFDATGASLPELFRSLNMAPDYKYALVQLAEHVARLEHEREHQEMLFEAEGHPPAPLPPGPRHKRDGPRLRVIKGGLAAFAPVAVLLAHGGPGPALGTAARWVWRAGSDHVRYVVAAVLIAAGGALVPVASAGELPAAHAPLMAVHGHDHDRPPARALHRARGAPRGNHS